jgi:hypothetical protein
MAQVEDIWWSHKASVEIAAAKVSAYFVWDPEDQPGNKDQPLAYVVVRLTEVFREQHKTQWARLTKEGFVELRIRNHECPSLMGKIMDRPDTIPCLADKHAMDKQFEYDIVVRVRVPKNEIFKTFESRVEVEEALKVRLNDLPLMPGLTDSFNQASDES